MKRKIAVFILSIVFIPLTFSQNETDALRYSQRFFGSTARSVSMGGAFASLGGDFFSLGYNPAGLGIYRTHEVTFSPSFNYNSVETEYMGTVRDDDLYSLGIGNFGVVASFNRENESGWVGTNIGIGFNRHNNFNRNRIIQGVNENSSMADYFMYNANGIEPEHLGDLEWMAYETFVIDLQEGEGDLYETPVMLGQTQREVKSAEGNAGEWTFAFAANYENMLYLGASFGVETVDYESRRRYHEVDDQNLSEFDEFKLTQILNTSGTGMTFKAGAVLRPVDMLRIGGAVHLPTFYNLRDSWEDSMESWFDPASEYYPSHSEAMIERKVKDYAINTPFRAIGGVSLMLFDKRGILSFDYEHVDYSSMRLRETDGGYDFYAENEEIRESFTSVGNLRAGAELRLGPFMLRGGYAYHPSPYASEEINRGADYTTYSGGFGFREGNFMIDFAFKTSTQSEYYFLYNLPADIWVPQMEPAKNNNNYNQFKATIGFKF